jgi:CelD/BcsL family acetyltransferase involved in cellulose biosynthesis
VDEESLEALIVAKSAQYQRTGVDDLFARRWVRDVAREVMAADGTAMTGVLSVLYAGDRPIAHHLGVRSGSTAHWWLPSYDVSASRYSPGLLLLMDFARHCESVGVVEIDLGPGDEQYKRRVMSSERTLDVATIEAPGMRRTFRRVRRGFKHVRRV